LVPDLRIQFARVGSVVVPVPRYQTDGAAGMDLHAALTEPIVVAIPPSFEGQVRPRSGLAWRTGLTVLNSPGTIDSDYRGEVQVLLVNLSDAPVTLAPLERIAQLVIAPVARAELVLRLTALDPTERGSGGLGSTGSA
jgi:dUTP pyrophosphatase